MNREMCEIIEKQLCREAEQIAENIRKNQTVSSQEVERLDKIFHVLKSQATYMAMKEAEEWDEGSSGYSGRRGRGADGRYVSREARESYSDGYNQGYSEAMNHYPTMPSNYGPRRW